MTNENGLIRVYHRYTRNIWDNFLGGYVQLMGKIVTSQTPWESPTTYTPMEVNFKCFHKLWSKTGHYLDSPWIHILDGNTNTHRLLNGHEYACDYEYIHIHVSLLHQIL